MSDNNLPQLNLPPARVATRLCNDGISRVFDPLRQKYVALTPEEWVRQHFVSYMVNDLGYPPGLLANEVSIKLNNTSRRCDTVLYSRNGLHPVMIVEYKAPHIAITQKVFDQIARYNLVLQVPYLIVSNGMRHFCCRVDPAAGTYAFLRAMPRFEEL